MAVNDILNDFSRQPYSLEAEQAVLGSIIIDPSCLNEIAVSVKTDYFYLPQHRDIYGAISTMFEFNQVIDFVSLLEKLKSNGTYDDDGGKAYLTQLVQSVSSSANVLEYVRIIRDKYYQRALLVAAKEIIKDVDENILDSDKLIDSAEQRIYDIRSGRDVSGLTHIKDVLEKETYDILAKKSNPETKDDYIGIPTGIKSLDRKIVGLNKSDLIILGARPGMGKTAFALNIARNVAVDSNKVVCFFSLEMSRDQLAQRLLSSEAAIKSEKLRVADLDADEWTSLAQAGAHLSTADLFIDETSTITVPEMKAKIKRMRKVDLVIVDYLGLMHTPRHIDNRVQEVSEITRSLKIMARELNVPVLVCSQLSRNTENKGKSHKPALADLRDSGSIEQDADIVLFLYREGYYDNEKSENEDIADSNKAECIVAKNRHGGLGTVDLYWDANHMRFTGIDNSR